MVVESAEARGWGPGYPNCQVGKIKTITRPDGLRLPVRTEIIPLVTWLLDRTEAQGYDVLPKGTWGYACRAIRGSTTPSNHSWGLAVDLNAPTNPMLVGQPGWKALHDSHRTDMPEWLPPLWKSLMFRWGGDYSHRQDAMHFEFMGTPADAARITATLATPTTPLKLTATLKEGSTGPFVVEVQQLLRQCGARHHDAAMDPGPADGSFGPKTAAAVAEFKRWVTLAESAAGKPHTFHAPDQFVGPVTLGAIQYWAAHT